MTDERLTQRLEEQLSEAHASNGALRERLAEAEKKEREANLIAAKGRDDSLRLEQASLRLKQAESFAQAAHRKQADAEREASGLRAENEELRERLDRVQKEADQLSELNVRIADAKRRRSARCGMTHEGLEAASSRSTGSATATSLVPT
jgi:phage shock protein A